MLIIGRMRVMCSADLPEILIFSEVGDVSVCLICVQGEASPCAAMCSPAAARIRRYPLWLRRFAIGRVSFI